MVLDYDTFYEDVWDYVSDTIVTDEFWENNQEFIREVTFDLYNMYKKTVVMDSYGEVIFNPLGPVISARIIEKFIDKVNKIGINRC